MGGGISDTHFSARVDVAACTWDGADESGAGEQTVGRQRRRRMRYGGAAKRAPLTPLFSLLSAYTPFLFFCPSPSLHAFLFCLPACSHLLRMQAREQRMATGVRLPLLRCRFTSCTLLRFLALLPRIRPPTRTAATAPTNCCHSACWRLPREHQQYYALPSRLPPATTSAKSIPTSPYYLWLYETIAYHDAGTAAAAAAATHTTTTIAHASTTMRRGYTDLTLPGTCTTLIFYLLCRRAAQRCPINAFTSLFCGCFHSSHEPPPPPSLYSHLRRQTCQHVLHRALLLLLRHRWFFCRASTNPSGPGQTSSRLGRAFCGLAGCAPPARTTMDGSGPRRGLRQEEDRLAGPSL